MRAGGQQFEAGVGGGSGVRSAGCPPTQSFQAASENLVSARLPSSLCMQKRAQLAAGPWPPAFSWAPRCPPGPRSSLGDWASVCAFPGSRRDWYRHGAFPKATPLLQEFENSFIARPRDGATSLLSPVHILPPWEIRGGSPGLLRILPMSALCSDPCPLPCVKLTVRTKHWAERAFSVSTTDSGRP